MKGTRVKVLGSARGRKGQKSCRGGMTSTFGVGGAPKKPRESLYSSFGTLKVHISKPIGRGGSRYSSVDPLLTLHLTPDIRAFNHGCLLLPRLHTTVYSRSKGVAAALQIHISTLQLLISQRSSSTFGRDSSSRETMCAHLYCTCPRVVGLLVPTPTPLKPERLPKELWESWESMILRSFHLLHLELRTHSILCMSHPHRRGIH